MSEHPTMPQAGSLWEVTKTVYPADGAPNMCPGEIFMVVSCAERRLRFPEDMDKLSLVWDFKLLRFEKAGPLNKVDPKRWPNFFKRVL